MRTVAVRFRPALGRILWVVAPTALSVGLLAALRPSYMLHWDEIQLALGVGGIDLLAHHPHPPCYYLFLVVLFLLR